MGRELIEDLVANAPDRQERALRAARRSIKARIGLWDGTLRNLRNSHRGVCTVETYAA